MITVVLPKTRQLALPSGGRGRRFKSSHPDHNKNNYLNWFSVTRKSPMGNIWVYIYLDLLD